MTEHITEWLGAYQDGELQGARLRQVEEHLAVCSQCQVELQEMRSLSALLHEAAPAADFQPAERFAANLALSLPRRSELPQPRRALQAGWWLTPLVVLGAWLFITITLWISSALILAVNTVLPGGGAALQGIWMHGSTQMGWFAITTSLAGERLGGAGWQILSMLNDAHLFVAQLSRVLMLQAVLALAYLGWLAAWWLRRGHVVENPGLLRTNRSQ